MPIFSALQEVIFLPMPSVFVNIMTAVSFVALASSGINEITGKKNLQYSKLVSSNKKEIPSKIGMLIFYTPAFLCGLASFFFFFPSSFNGDDTRFLLIRAALTLHFLKRITEVLFIHKFSGGMATEAAIATSLSYFTGTLTMIYAQHLSLQLPKPSIDMKYFGVVLFIIGTSGNYYHHYILSNLRRKDEKDYKIPKGGMFDLVICPHYLFEVLAFWGLTFITQTLYTLSFAAGTTIYLMGRSVATRRWYVSKFKGFPRQVKCVIPFVF